MVLWVYTFVAQVLLVNLLIAMMSETYQTKKEGGFNEYLFQRIEIVDEFMGSVFFVPPPFSMPYLACKLLGGLPGWVKYLCYLRADAASFVITINPKCNQFDQEEVQLCLHKLLQLPHQDDISVELYYQDQYKVRVSLYGHAELMEELNNELTAKDHDTAADYALKELRDLTALAPANASPKLGLDSSAILNISTLAIDKRSYRDSLKPKPETLAEDLMTFHLPTNAGKLLNWRRDLIMLKEYLDSKEAKKQASMETQLMAEQRRMHTEMLKTQEVTFALKKRVEGLVSKFGEGIAQAHHEAMSASYQQPPQQSKLLSAPLPDASVPSTPQKAYQTFRRMSQVINKFTANDGSAQATMATPAGGAAPTRQATDSASIGATGPLAMAGGGANTQSGALPAFAPSQASQINSTLASCSYGLSRQTEIMADDEDDPSGSKKLRQALAEAERRCGELEDRNRQRDAHVHVNARSKHPDYPERLLVPDDKVEWSVRWDDYTPLPYTASVVRENDSSLMGPSQPKNRGWADPQDPLVLGHEEWSKRISFEGEIVFTASGFPRNPRGRTGMRERGLLGKWGPNHAADPIVTRYNPAHPSQLQMVAIKRRDTGVWAIPGGMVDAGETVSVTVKREFMEEAGNLPKDQQEAFKKIVDQLFAGGEVVYRGYVDDPRNTDNAWMETTAFHFHCEMEVGRKIKLKSGDDAADVMWLDVDEAEPKYLNLYASHRTWVDRIAAQMRSKRLETSMTASAREMPPIDEAGGVRSGRFTRTTGAPVDLTRYTAPI